MSFNWLIVATVAQFILGSSAIFDKLLLRKRSIEPWAYTFWLGIFGAFAIILLPFGYQPTGAKIIALAIISGTLFIAAFFFNFRALEESEVSEALPLIGVMTPIVTLALSSRFLGTSLGRLDWFGFAFLLSSGFILFLTERRQRRGRVLRDTALASGFFAASTVSAKAVFGAASFITGFFWIKLGGVLAALAFLLIPHIRKLILRESEAAPVKNRWLYGGNRAYAGAGSVLISVAVFLANPALVEATQNLKFAVIFLLAMFIAGERFRRWVLAGKITAAILIAIGLSWLALGEYSRSLPAVEADRPITWGVTFSGRFSRELGLDPQKTLSAVLEELQPKKIRLVAYWNEIEETPGEFYFSDLDWQLDAAERAGVEVILVAGLKVPRWPECHVPQWASGLGVEEREEALRAYLERLVTRYLDNPANRSWQIENEPFLMFGQCGRRGRDFLAKEISLVKSIDPSRPILTTDGGEFGLWVRAERYGDEFGTTMYRKVYPRIIGPIFGIVEYPIGPDFFRVKELIVRWVNKSPSKRFIVSELQAEPWFPTSLAEMPVERQIEEFSPEYFRETIQFAKGAGFDEYYLWGAEWWYYMKKKHGNSEYWEIAETLFSSGQ